VLVLGQSEFALTGLVLGKDGNDLVDDLDGVTTLALGLADDLGVSALVFLD
jgi:hypothetical protein